MEDDERPSADTQAVFRAGNEALRRNADSKPTDLPLMCECGLASCFERLVLAKEEYEVVRSHPRRFVVAVGHEDNGDDESRVVERRDAYSVIEKVDGAGEIAVRRDPRREDG
jgi:hypothetical protein